MIGNQIKSFVGALMIVWTTVSNAGCNIEGIAENIKQESATQFTAETGTASDIQPGNGNAVFATGEEPPRTAYPTYAEARHFAIYNLYRFLTESSGGSGHSASENTPGGLLLWSGKLIGMDCFSCLDQDFDK
jgi:hypothetical protein